MNYKKLNEMIEMYKSLSDEEKTEFISMVMDVDIPPDLKENNFPDIIPDLESFLK